ncbi:cystatin-B-like [Neoarius graeffei]|uniref:cystatin-B-like n=1 Tax=Neoarius graeffei TaxID=443677 RepID=UPI00298C1327|nr:cystatin-B-like [Neoarius graeffei]
MAMMCGGTGYVRNANREVEKICDEVKPQVEEKAGKNFDVFKAISFSTQTVSGMNYFIKVHVGEDEYVHLRVFRSLPCEGYKLSLAEIQTSKAREDPVEYF